MGILTSKSTEIIELDLYGEKFQIRNPTALQMDQFHETLKAIPDQTEQNKYSIEFCFNLIIPDEDEPKMITYDELIQYKSYKDLISIGDLIMTKITEVDDSVKKKLDQ